MHAHQASASARPPLPPQSLAQNAAILNKQGKTTYENGKNKQSAQAAIIFYNQAIALNPDDQLHANILINRAVAYGCIGSWANYQKALTDYDSAIEVSPSALAFFKRGKFKEFLAKSKNALQYGLTMDSAIADFKMANQYEPTKKEYSDKMLSLELKPIDPILRSLPSSRTVSLPVSPGHSSAPSRGHSRRSSFSLLQGPGEDFDTVVTAAAASSVASKALSLSDSVFSNFAFQGQNMSEEEKQFYIAGTLKEADDAKRANNFEEALEKYQNVLHCEPHNEIAFNELSWIAPLLAEKLFLFANEERQRGAFKSAIVQYTKSLALLRDTRSRDYSLALLYRGESYAEIEEYQLAILDFESVILMSSSIDNQVRAEQLWHVAYQNFLRNDPRCNGLKRSDLQTISEQQFSERKQKIFSQVDDSVEIQREYRKKCKAILEPIEREIAGIEGQLWDLMAGLEKNRALNADSNSPDEGETIFHLEQNIALLQDQKAVLCQRLRELKKTLPSNPSKAPAPTTVQRPPQPSKKEDYCVIS